MEALVEVSELCPHCNAAITLLIDNSAGAQDYIEDCEVCCQPVLVCIQPGEPPCIRLERET